MTTLSFVPGGKLTTRVPGSVPNSTLRFVEVVAEEVVDCAGVLTSGFVTLDGVVAISDSGVRGVDARNWYADNNDVHSEECPDQAAAVLH